MPDVAVRLTGWGHTRRAVKNLALDQRQLLWDGRSIGVRANGQSKTLTEARRDFDWIGDFPAQAAQQAFIDLDRAYDNWWNHDHPAGPPTHEKRSNHLSFRLPGQAIDIRHLDRKWSEICVPKIGWVRFRRHRPINGEVRSATFTYSPGDGWQVSFAVAAKEHKAPANGKPGVGSDFGVACSAFMSDESEPRLMDPTLTSGEQRRLLGLERQKARQVAWAKRHNGGRYSKRLRHTINEIARLRARQARRRLDFTHKLTHDMAYSHGFVGIEDLRVKNMTASAKGTVETPGTNVAQKSGLNRGILDNAPGERRRQLSYKCPKFGSDLRPVPPFHTSNTCPNPECRKVDPANRLGCGREFACVHCGFQDHADHVASVNIFRLAEAQGPSLLTSKTKKKFQSAAQTAGPADNSTGRRKPSQSRKAEGGSVKRVAPVEPDHSVTTGRVESRVA